MACGAQHSNKANQLLILGGDEIIRRKLIYNQIFKLAINARACCFPTSSALSSSTCASATARNSGVGEKPSMRGRKHSAVLALPKI